MLSPKFRPQLWGTPTQVKCQRRLLSPRSLSYARHFTLARLRAVSSAISHERSTTWRPYLPIYVGVAFIGTMMYGIINGETTKFDSPSNKSAASLAEVDEVTKRRTKIN